MFGEQIPELVQANNSDKLKLLAVSRHTSVLFYFLKSPGFTRPVLLY